MPKTNHPRISRTEWDAHKETIRKMYLLEKKGLEGEGGVIDLMNRKGFSASKPQYESQFIRWGFKKKLTRETWHIIGHIVKDRAEAGLVSRVYAHGTSFTTEKVKKEIARYKCEDRECCLKKELPPGVEVRSDHEEADQEDGDQDEVEEMIPSFEAQSIHLNNLSTANSSRNLRISDEPWNSPSHYSHFRPHNSKNTTKNTRTCDLNLSMGDDTSYFTPFLGTLYSVTSPLPTPSTQFEDDARFVLSNTSSLEELFETSFPGYQYSTLPPFSAPSGQFNNHIRHLYTYARRPVESCSIPLSTISLFTDLNKPLFREFRALINNYQPQIDTSINKMKYLLPPETGRELQKDSVDIVILKQILYLLMNNFAGSDYAVFDAIFEQVRQFSTTHMEEMLNALPGPYAAALQQSILTIAIKSNIPALVSVLLRRGLDVNRVACRFGRAQYTPLGLACRFHRLEVVKILLRAGADPNRSTSPYHNPIYLLTIGNPLLRGDEEIRPPMMGDILQCLLVAHARVIWSVFENPVFWDNEILLDVFIQHNKLPLDFTQEPSFYVDEIPVSMGLCKAEKVLAVFRSAFHGLTLEADLKSVRKHLQSALRIASSHSSLSVVDYLLELGLSPDFQCLSQAIYDNNIVLAKKYIQLGLDIHDESSYLFRRKDPVRILPSTVDSCLLGGFSFRGHLTTPFAEAVRHGRQEMISLFKNSGVSRGATSSIDVGIIVLAAAEVGNKDMVQEFLTMEQSYIHRRSFSVSVAAATLGGNEDIVELLMRAGVRPDLTSITAAILTRNIRLVELFLNSTDFIDTKKPLAYLAVRWGNHKVLGWLIDAGFDLDGRQTDLDPLQVPSLGEGENFQPLGEAIRQGNHGLVQLLLKNGASINGSCPVNKNSPLAQAVKCSNEPLVQTLLDHGADPNDPHAFQTAVNTSHTLTRVILTSFRQRYPKGNSSFAVPALLDAIRKQDEKMVSMLASHSDISLPVYYEEHEYDYRKLSSILGEGIETGNVRIVQILLDSGVNADGTVELGYRGRFNAVLKVISTENLDMVKLLHSAGANLNFSATLRITRTALQLAVELGHFEIVEFLLEQGVDVNAPPCVWEGGTALQYAAQTGSVRTAEILIEYGADINAPGSKYLGKTAFEFAAEHGRMDMLLLLFHRGVDIVSDGGKQIRRAQELAEANGQIAAKDLVAQLSEEAHRRASSGFESNFLPGLMTGTSIDLGLSGIE